ncbi:hypothetical protein [Lentisalinibacter sediminis]|uniref:hypothetical protein n=1 Tax=Lentisalinibacter sediminis TaxID=2992237 RepID=UPI00386890B4
MITRHLAAGILLILATTTLAVASEPPRLTAQGFAITSTQRGEPGEFPPVRLRAEAPARIASLVIRQGEFEADLATTPDRSLFPLFGLESRPLQAYDVTLDFSPYINERLAADGEYLFLVTLTDREDRRSTATLEIAVGEPELPPEPAAGEAFGRALEASDAVLRRLGAGPVRAAGISGLTWVTVEPIDVTIRVRPAQAGLSLRELPAGIWPELTDTLALAGAVAATDPVEFVDLPAANRTAAGRVLVLSDAAGHTAFRITGSATAVSAKGTTVELVGRVRR